MSQLLLLKRASATMDADEKGRWITTENGNHVHIDKSGKPDKGNPHVIKAMKKGGKSAVGKKSDKAPVGNGVSGKGSPTFKDSASAAKAISSMLGENCTPTDIAKAVYLCKKHKNVLGGRLYKKLLDKADDATWNKSGTVQTKLPSKFLDKDGHYDMGKIAKLFGEKGNVSGAEGKSDNKGGAKGSKPSGSQSTEKMLRKRGMTPKWAKHYAQKMDESKHSQQEADRIVEGIKNGEYSLFPVLPDDYATPIKFYPPSKYEPRGRIKNERGREFSAEEIRNGLVNGEFHVDKIKKGEGSKR